MCLCGLYLFMVGSVNVFCIAEQPDAGEDPEFVRAKYFFRDEFLVNDVMFCVLCHVVDNLKLPH